MNLKKIGKIAGNIFYTIAILLILWVAVSYIDVIAHNLSGGTDASWNFFVILSNW